LKYICRRKPCREAFRGVEAWRGACGLRKWVVLIGSTVVCAVCGVAGAEALLSHEVVRATAILAGGIFTIPLAAAIRN
jgi:hypothetical protein